MGTSKGPANSSVRDHFIPIRKSELVVLLRDELPEKERQEFEQLCHIIESVFHHEYHQRLEALKGDYAAFDPDADTRPTRTFSDQQRKQAMPSLFERFSEMLERANYRRLERGEIDQLLEVAGKWGVRLEVDFEILEQFEVYVRGSEVDRTTRRRWQKLYKSEEAEVPVYQRLVLIFRHRPHRRLPKNADTDKVFIKLFKNIPHHDLKILLPGVRVRMTLLDQARIAFPTITGIGITVSKIVAKGLVAFGTMTGTLALLGMIGGLIGYGVKSFIGFLRTKEKHQLTLTKNLYYQNLDNNAGVLFRLLDDAEEQEFREAVLAYFLLWQRAPAEGWTVHELDRRAEILISKATGVDTDFEVGDAVTKLFNLDMVACGAAGKLIARPIGEALMRLDQRWDDYFRHQNGAPASSLPVKARRARAA